MEKIQDRFFTEIKEKFDSLGVKAVLFDFDDTLIYTSELFKKYMDEFVFTVCEETGKSFESVDGHLRKINDEEYKTMGVNPARWEEVVRRMANEEEGYADSATKNLSTLMKIYTDEPRIRPGAKAILEILKRNGLKIGLVTHANVDWTWRKLNSTSMLDYFDSIVIADENKHKGVQHWQSVMTNLEVLPQECLVVGDSLSGDIIPTAEIGSKTMWLHQGSTWSMYRTGNVPETTVHLDEVNQLISALDQLR